MCYALDYARNSTVAYPQLSSDLSHTHFLGSKQLRHLIHFGFSYGTPPKIKGTSDMLPEIPRSDFAYHGQGDAVLGGQIGVGCAFRGSDSDLDYLGLRELAIVLSLSSCLAALVYFVSHIFLHITAPQMIRIGALWGIARMANTKAIGDQYSVMYLPGCAMGVIHFPSPIHYTIAAARDCPLPHPALIKRAWCAVGPKIVCKCRVFRLVFAWSQFLRRIERGILDHVVSPFSTIGHASGRLQRRAGASIGFSNSILAQMSRLYNGAASAGEKYRAAYQDLWGSS